jgi:hypothetical protein
MDHSPAPARPTSDPLVDLLVDLDVFVIGEGEAPRRTAPHRTAKCDPPCSSNPRAFLPPPLRLPLPPQAAPLPPLAPERLRTKQQISSFPEGFTNSVDSTN